MLSINYNLHKEGDNNKMLSAKKYTTTEHIRNVAAMTTNSQLNNQLINKNVKKMGSLPHLA